MRFGMSEKLGPRVLGRGHDMPFLGREMSAEPDYSDEVAREIDDEIRRIIEEGHDLATRVLREHIDELHRISQILIERETIDKDQFIALLAGESEDAVFPPDPRSRSRWRARAAPAAEAAAVPAPGRRRDAAAARAERQLAELGTWFVEPSSSGRQGHARADRGALPGPVGDGRPERDARLVLRRRRASARRAGGHIGVGDARGGAAIVDVGGESTRPGSGGVDADEELRRVEPVLADLAGAPVSIDTSKAAVARRALELGVGSWNDVTALRGDTGLAEVVAESDCYLCLMHMQGEPRTMQVDPVYDDVVSDVKRFLEERLAFAVSAGIREGSSASIPVSDSARRPRTTSSSCAGSTSCARSAGRCSSASRARARSER